MGLDVLPWCPSILSTCVTDPRTVGPDFFEVSTLTYPDFYTGGSLSNPVRDPSDHPDLRTSLKNLSYDLCVPTKSEEDRRRPRGPSLVVGIGLVCLVFLYSNFVVFLLNLLLLRHSPNPSLTTLL